MKLLIQTISIRYTRYSILAIEYTTKYAPGVGRDGEELEGKGREHADLFKEALNCNEPKM